MAALLANSGIAVTKFLAFFLTGISSMLAEAIHSVADAGNQGLLLLGGKKANRAATEEHPFGYGRERYVYAFIVSIVLFTVGGLFAVREGVHKFQEIRDGHHEDPGQWWWVPLVVLGLAIVLEIAVVPHRDHRDQQGPGRGVVRRVRPPLQEARAARHPARGPGRAPWPLLRVGGRGPVTAH